MSRIQRGDVASIVLPDEVSKTLLAGVAEDSIVQRYANARRMTAQNVQITEAELTGANVFWVGEGARKSTDAPTMSQATWTLSAAELAVIVPVDENVLDDANVDLFEIYQTPIENAIAKKLDQAALFGIDKPSAWGTNGTDIVPGAATAAHAEIGDGSETTAEILADIEDMVESLENDLYDPNGFLGQVRFKSVLRGMKDGDNRYMFGDAKSDGVPSDLLGVPLEFVKRDAWPTVSDPDATLDGVHLILGDWEQALVGTRAGVKYKKFDQGVITDGAGNVVYSLMENDMVALRVTARYGFKVFAPDTADGETLASGERFPFATYRPAAS